MVPFLKDDHYEVEAIVNHRVMRGRTGPAAEMKSSCKFQLETCSGSGTGSQRAQLRARGGDGVDAV